MMACISSMLSLLWCCSVSLCLSLSLLQVAMRQNRAFRVTLTNYTSEGCPFTNNLDIVPMDAVAGTKPDTLPSAPHLAYRDSSLT